VKIGCFLPQIGPFAGPEAIATAAQSAEAVGFDSVWVTDRLLFPVNPKNPYAAEPSGKLPDVYKIVYDPLETLLWAAAHTKTVRLGTSVLDMPFYNPILLSRRVAAIDQMSGGRLTLGLGQGWSEDEYEATNADATKRGRRANEFLEVLHAIWKSDRVAFDGRYFKLSESYIAPKPVQKPHPPVYMAAYSPGAMKRVAKYADGWHPVGLPFGAIPQMFDSIKSMAKEEGRKPEELKLSIRGNLHLSDSPAGEGRWAFHGNKDEIKQDVAAARELNADELVVDVTFSPGVKSVADFVAANEMVRELVG
jgi:probable F420-dependent oxidoreductase